MNLEPMYELKNRLSASAVAGTKLMGEDFRLKRAVEQAAPLAAANQVFGSIIAKAQALLEPGCPDRNGMLLDTLALLDAVLCTQGVTNVAGDLTPVPLAEGTSYVQRPYSALAPLLEALTGTGSGRYTVIEDAINHTPELLEDYRLRQALVNALGDSYSETASRIEEWMKKRADASLVPLLKQGFDPQGKQEMVRRVEVIDALAGGGENGWYLEQLEQKCAPGVRSALIVALRHEHSNGEKLTALVQSERGDAKKAALSALSYMEGPEYEAFWISQIKKKPDIAVEYLIMNDWEPLSELVAEKLDAVLDELLAGDGILQEKQEETLFLWISAAHNKRTEGMKRFFRRAAEHGKVLSELKHADPKNEAIQSYLVGSWSSCCHPAAQIGEVVANTILWSMDEGWMDLALECYQKWPSEVTAQPALISAFLRCPAGEVYDTFTPDLRMGIQLPFSKKIKRNAWDKSGGLELLRTFGRLEYSDGQYLLYTQAYLKGNTITYEVEKRCRALKEPLDPRWATFLTEQKHFQKVSMTVRREGSTRNMSFELALGGILRTDNDEECALARKFYHSRLGEIRMRDMFRMLMRYGQTDMGGLVVEYAKKYKRWDYEIFFWMREFFTPQQAAAELQALASLMREGTLENANKRYNDPILLENNAKLILEEDGFSHIRTY